MRVKSRIAHACTIAVAGFMLAPIASAAAAPTPKPKAKNFIRVYGTQKFGKTGDVLREQVECPQGFFAVNGGYLTSGVVVSTWENFALRHPEGWVAEVYAPPAPPPLAPMDDVSLSVFVECAKAGIPVVPPIDNAGHPPKSKPTRKNFVTVLGPVQQGKSGDKLQEEVDCPKGFFAINGGYVASGIIVSTWESYPVRHPEGWVAEIYAPPNGPFGPAQDISLRAKVDCARSGVPLVFPASTAGKAPGPNFKGKRFVTVYGTEQRGKSGDRLRDEADCPKGWFALNGGAASSGQVSTWESFPARRPDGWVGEIYAAPAGPYSPPQDISLRTKVDCAKGGVPVVFPTG